MAIVKIDRVGKTILQISVPGSEYEYAYKVDNSELCKAMLEAIENAPECVEEEADEDDGDREEDEEEGIGSEDISKIVSGAIRFFDAISTKRKR